MVKDNEQIEQHSISLFLTWRILANANVCISDPLEMLLVLEGRNILWCDNYNIVTYLPACNQISLELIIYILYFNIYAFISRIYFVVGTTIKLNKKKHYKERYF